MKLILYHTHTQFTEESKVATTLTPQTDITSGKSHVTDGEPETVVLASLQRIKSIKNQIKFFFFFLISLNLKLVTHLSVISMVILHT